MAAGQVRQRRPARPSVEVSGLVREFGSSRDPLRAVDNIDLTVHTGENYGVLGPNRAGKTMVHILTTLLRSSAGQALVTGHDAVRQADAVRRSIGVALQEAAIRGRRKATLKDGGRMFCDVFHFRDDKICRLVTYQVDRHPGNQTRRAFDA